MFNVKTNLKIEERKPIAGHILYIIIGQFSQTRHCEVLKEHMSFLSEELKLDAKYLACSLIKFAVKNQLFILDDEALKKYIVSLLSAFESVVESYKRYAKYKAKGYVYFLLTKNAPEPLVKIGYQSTVNNSRSNEIHSHCPYDLIHIGSCKVANGQSSEKKLHRKLEYYRFNREWFRYEGKLKETVDFLINRGYYDCIDSSTNAMAFIDWLISQTNQEKSSLKFVADDLWYDLDQLWCGKEYKSIIIDWANSFRQAAIKETANA